MKMGPLWDFDWACVGPEIDNYVGTVEDLRSQGNWFSLMLDGSPEFRALVKDRFDEVRPALVAALDKAESESGELMPYFTRNHLKWHWFRLFTSPESRFEDVITWTHERIDWLDGYFSEIASR